MQRASQFRNFFFTGTEDASGATYNKVFADVDRVASYLFSPVDPRFAIEFDNTQSPEVRAQARAAASWLSREFQHNGVDSAAADAVLWALIEASCLIKLGWGRHGFDPFIVRQGFFAVFNEGIADLNRQDAFVHTVFVTPASFDRMIAGHPEEAELRRKVRTMAQEGLETSPNPMRELLIGGVNPVALTPLQEPQPAGWVRWLATPQPTLDPQTRASLIQIDELWVQDNEREDYTTFQVAGDDVVIEGKLQRRNLFGIKGLHPFINFCPMPVDGYFWGRSEVAGLMQPQTALNKQVNGINRVMRMQEDPPQFGAGIAGDPLQKRAAMMKPGGFWAEAAPNVKIENMAPKLPEQAVPWVADLDRFFDAASGFESPILRGHGEPGVRSGTHGETLVRMASPRMRDRAILIERTYAALGALGFELARVKVPDRFEITEKIDGKDEQIAFTLDQIPSKYRLTVDSHSTSPAFSEEEYQRVLNLAKMKAIDDVDLIRLTHPPQEDTLIADAEKRHREQAAFLAQHPELLKHHK